MLEITVDYVEDEVTFKFMERKIGKKVGIRTAELPKPEMVSK